MRKAFRIFKKKYRGEWYDGEGAFRYGGRWNSRGTRIFYASATLSLAALELLVNLTEFDALLGYSYAEIEFDPGLVQSVANRNKLPPNWRSSPPPAKLRAIGDEWVASGASAVLEVPSAVVPVESNFLVNVQHPAFHDIMLGKVRDFKFDSRLKWRQST
ncbi:MAG: RES family NAD+ phosphorylase [Acidobacteria bacterium]|nr:RES family NAD+ phosphorylase [Acidobacteriota bacterium]